MNRGVREYVILRSEMESIRGSAFSLAVFAALGGGVLGLCGGLVAAGQSAFTPPLVLLAVLAGLGLLSAIATIVGTLNVIVRETKRFNEVYLDQEGDGLVRADLVLAND